MSTPSVKFREIQTPRVTRQIHNSVSTMQVRAYDADEWEAAFGHLRAHLAYQK